MFLSVALSAGNLSVCAGGCSSAAIWRLHQRSSYNCSGGFRNLIRGIQPLAREARMKIFGLPRTFRSRWKSELNISKQL